MKLERTVKTTNYSQLSLATDTGVVVAGAPPPRNIIIYNLHTIIFYQIISYSQRKSSSYRLTFLQTFLPFGDKYIKLFSKEVVMSTTD
jgi:hypothetical protein